MVVRYSIAENFVVTLFWIQGSGCVLSFMDMVGCSPLDNPSGGCPTAPTGIRNPCTIIIGNIYVQFRRDGIFCGVRSGILVKGHWRRCGRWVYHSKAVRSHNPRERSTATYVMLCKSRRFPPSDTKAPPHVCNCNLLPVRETLQRI